MNKVLLIIGLVIVGVIFSGCTTYKYAVCGTGWGAPCIITNDLDQIKKDGECITDGIERICGSYSVSDGGGYTKRP